jgi:hypothetical protein
MDERLHQAIMGRLKDGRLPCNQAHAVAKLEGIDPLTLGFALNDVGIRVSRCQLGLFGYGPKAEGKHKTVEPMDEVPGRLAERLQAAAKDGGLACDAAWKIADGMGLERIVVSSAMETMGLRTTHCQLACFPRPWVPWEE